MNIQNTNYASRILFPNLLDANQLKHSNATLIEMK